ncbi:MAG TPA: glutamine synthetase III [Candidatus Ornithoclostridium excrementipullorum]|nr:glutamine synthetase III [Candidatus Ornithoclostridium excrementipullorum]
MKASEIFGENVFDLAVMRDKLPKDVYKSLVNTIGSGAPLEPGVASVVANAMKDWAVEKGATHFTHWFQPMTGITAEKHDSFVSPDKDGKAIMEFSGKELVMGEPDASSFPSGGVRATFEARGYTAWDPTSYAFVKDGTLYVPSVFFSYSGEVLDKKTPLLKSMRALNREAMRILKMFGYADVKQVFSTVGAEQEYFLIDKKDYLKRKDLIYTGRTLFGAKPPKGQELEDHYFGAIKTRVSEYMRDLDEELWKLGIYSKTKHNEVAPSQHELAPLFASSNLANDQNQLIMEMMKRVADRHGMHCLLHEKPFAGINGSGKHNNWSMSTDTGVNLLDPGSTPAENSRFMLFFAAVIKAVDEYQDLLRLSVASAGNDHRLGANEAPPAVVSVYVGEELAEVLKAFEKDEKYAGRKKSVMKLGVDTLPDLPKDTTDRNRTSPFAFTGNKFEFRMVGSSFSLAGPNIVINTIVADVLRRFADELESAKDFNASVHDIVVRTIRENKRIIFNGNNYSEEWLEEAKRRGLSNLKNAAEALPLFAERKSVELFERMEVMSEREVVTRTEIMLDNYCKVLAIEGLTMSEMVKRDIYPAVDSYIASLCKTAEKKSRLGASSKVDEELVRKLSDAAETMWTKTEELDRLLADARSVEGAAKQAAFFADRVLPVMQEIRIVADRTETETPKGVWPYPSYGELLFGV